MLLLHCPHCGARDYTEFSYGGDATLRRPDPRRSSDAEWHAYVYLRDNPIGEHSELWQHSAGCRQWLRVRRNVSTHEVLEVSALHASLAAERGGA